ncbi:tRNA uridine-5-carboxymethylaminomethyl(34) synthesis GTPase MnmE [Mycoplasma sp. P36-A1]|uniref:tRNA uridine-5-carboxymethylaminomethyl(34) synthesis GTPase MnmE n=1 Tax=Mycoplasma sp. P36-A1 TaxID=3252900 RepID=UPI003C2F2BE4
MINDTIVALATPNMKSAISMLRVSGDEAIEIVDNIFTKSLKEVESHTIHYGYIKDHGEKIDEVLVSVFRAPKSFTTEDVVEISTHGGVAISRKVLNLLLSKGARLANAGEFTQRAYLHGRIDMIEVEAINDMIDAKTEKAATLAMSGLSKQTTNLIQQFKEELLQIIAVIEVNIDYPEYDDVKELSNQEVKNALLKFKKDIEYIIKNSKTSNMIKNGIKVAIVGLPNAGKSSLLNAFLETDKAIVTDVEGTTRDVLEAEYLLNGINLIFLDTAGIRDTTDIVESIGIKKAKTTMDNADLILLVVDASKPKLDLFEEKLIKDKSDKVMIVLNKTDIANNIQIDGIKISALNQDIENLKTKMIERLDLDIDITSESLFLANQRHLALLNKINSSIDQALSSIEMQVPADLVVSDIEEAYEYLQELLGLQYKESLLDELFSRFCLGK